MSFLLVMFIHGANINVNIMQFSSIETCELAMHKINMKESSNVRMVCIKK